MTTNEEMEFKTILWLDDQFEDLSAYLGHFFMTGYLVDCVRPVSEAIQKIEIRTICGRDF